MPQQDLWPTSWARAVYSCVGAITEHTALTYTTPDDLQLHIDRRHLSREWYTVGDTDLAIITPADAGHGLVPEWSESAVQAALAWGWFEKLRTRIARLLWLPHHAVAVLHPDGRAVVHALRLSHPAWWNLEQLHYDTFHTDAAQFPGHDRPHRIVVHTDAPHTALLPGMSARPVNVAALLRRGGIL